MEVFFSFFHKTVDKHQKIWNGIWNSCSLWSWFLQSLWRPILAGYCPGMTYFAHAEIWVCHRPDSGAVHLVSLLFAHAVYTTAGSVYCADTGKVRGTPSDQKDRLFGRCAGQNFCEKQTFIHNLFTIKGAFVLTFEDRQSQRSLLQ